jgi:hypothetical protein
MIAFTWTLLDLTILIRHLKPERGNISVVQQSVKDVLDDLKGDGLVDFDKIGTSNCTSIFPLLTSPAILALFASGFDDPSG